MRSVRKSRSNFTRSFEAEGLVRLRRVGPEDLLHPFSVFGFAEDRDVVANAKLRLAFGRHQLFTSNDHHRGGALGKRELSQGLAAHATVPNRDASS